MNHVFKDHDICVKDNSQQKKGNHRGAEDSSSNGQATNKTNFNNQIKAVLMIACQFSPAEADDFLIFLNQEAWSRRCNYAGVLFFSSSIRALR